MSASIPAISNHQWLNTHLNLEHNYPDRVYFGDTHVHTSYSTDAGVNGYYSVSLRYFHEFSVKNRLEGDTAWLTVSLPLWVPEDQR